MIIRVTLFLVFFTALSTYKSIGSTISTVTEQLDSVCLKVIYNKKDLRSRHRYIITIFFNKVLYISDAYPDNGCIYIPDTLKPNDKIKIKIKPNGSGQRWTNQIVKSKVFRFNYSESEKTILKITYKNGVNLFRMNPKRYPPNFW